MSTQGVKERVLSTYVHPLKKSYITARGVRLEWTPSKFTSKIIDWWIAAGCPHVHSLEDGLPDLPQPTWEDLPEPAGPLNPLPEPARPSGARVAQAPRRSRGSA